MVYKLRNVSYIHVLMTARNLVRSLRHTTLSGNLFQSPNTDGKKEMKNEEDLQLINPTLQELSRRAEVYDGESSRELYNDGM